MADKLQNFIFDHHPVRGAFVRLDSIYQSVLQSHDYPEPIQSVLAEAMIGVLLLASLNKVSGRVSLQFQGGEIIRLLSVQYTSAGFVRGLVQFDTTVPLDQARLIADLATGALSVIYQSDHAAQQYQSVVSFEGNSILDSLEHYFGQSEQQLTKIKLARNQSHLAGLMLQMMPERDRLDRPAESWAHLTTLLETLSLEELLDCDNEGILHRLYHQEDVRLFDSVPLKFGCEERQRRFENAVLSMGLDEAESVLAEHSAIEITCEFCCKAFTFDRVDVESLFRTGKTSAAGQH